jgi:hypothetical protein
MTAQQTMRLHLLAITATSRFRTQHGVPGMPEESMLTH